MKKKMGGGGAPKLIIFFLQSYGFCSKYNGVIVSKIKVEMPNTGEVTRVEKKNIIQPDSPPYKGE